MNPVFLNTYPISVQTLTCPRCRLPPSERSLDKHCGVFGGTPMIEPVLGRGGPNMVRCCTSRGRFSLGMCARTARSQYGCGLQPIQHPLELRFPNTSNISWNRYEYKILAVLADKNLTPVFVWLNRIDATLRPPLQLQFRPAAQPVSSR
jgi:hypothetical protein